MSTLLDELSKKAQTLTIEDRVQLAQELLESVRRDADPDVQAAWEVEMNSRRASAIGFASLSKQQSLLCPCIQGWGRRWRLRTRRAFLKGVPFSVVYRIEAAELVVFAVAHFRRRPTCW